MANEHKRSSVFKLGYNAYANPFTRNDGKEKAWGKFADNLNQVGDKVKEIWHKGWDSAEKSKANKSLEIR